MSAIARAASWDMKWEFLFVVWIPIVGLIIQSAIEYFKRRDELEGSAWSYLETTRLDDLTRDDLQRMDRLVRDQCEREINHARSTLEDLRSRLYQSGERDQALEIKQLERKFENGARQVQDIKFGSAPYLSDLHLGQALVECLDFDETLLVRVSALSEDVQDIRQSLSQRQFDLRVLKRLEDQLSAFLYRFETRSRALKPSAEAQQKYRMNGG